jgi:hypothetical protein
MMSLREIGYKLWKGQSIMEIFWEIVHDAFSTYFLKLRLSLQVVIITAAFIVCCLIAMLVQFIFKTFSWLIGFAGITYLVIEAIEHMKIGADFEHISQPENTPIDRSEPENTPIDTVVATKAEAEAKAAMSNLLAMAEMAEMAEMDGFEYVS